MFEGSSQFKGNKFGVTYPKPRLSLFFNVISSRFRQLSSFYTVYTLFRYALSFFNQSQSGKEDESDDAFLLLQENDDQYQDFQPSLKPPQLSPTSTLIANKGKVNKNEELKLQWELQYQSQLAELAAEMEHLERSIVGNSTSHRDDIFLSLGCVDFRAIYGVR